ncbi:hypothetical protein HDU99_010383, partial [Rhizoclosmatium hyalinum]
NSNATLAAGDSDPLAVVASKSNFATSRGASRQLSINRNASISQLLLTGNMTQSQAALSLADLSFAATISSIPQPQRNNSLPRLNSQQPLPQVPQAQNGAQKQQDQGPYHPPMLQLHMTASNTISLPFSGNMTSFPPAEANHAIIQSTWSLFAAMEDNQRNQLLK